MRILLVSGSTPPVPCGVGDFTAALAGALAPLPGNRVAILAGPGMEDEVPIADYELLRPVRSWRLGSLPKLWRALRAWRPDVVHLQFPTHNLGSGWVASLVPMLAWAAGALPVRTWHEPFTRRNASRFLLQSAAPGPAIVVHPDYEARLWPPLRRLLRRRRVVLIRGASAIPRSRLSAAQVERLRSRMLGGASRLIAFFGFLHPLKGVERVFDIARPDTDKLVIAGETGIDRDYSARIAALAEADAWRGRATLTGFLPPTESADLLAAADVVVLPFTEGSGAWNSSIHAAVLQGTPVVTTSRERTGWDGDLAVYRAVPDDVADMARAVDRFCAGPRPRPPVGEQDEWARVAREHMQVYRQASAGRA